MQYTTQMDAARKGIHTEALKIVAEKENYDIDKLCTLVDIIVFLLCDYL